ncbi:MAG TPA: hypothetical protein VFZ11_15360, partial [Gemmatimonadaceae bacterium]
SMAVLDVLRGAVSERCVPAMLGHAAATGRVVLGVWEEPQPGLLLGRFHATAEEGTARRRHTGGRAVPVGPDHVRVALALPHRSALESDDPSALRPEQAMNRCVRGLLGALRVLGTDAFYPGRDVVTAAGAPIAWLSIGEEESGATLFDAGLHVATIPAAPREDGEAAVLGAYRSRPWSTVGDLDVERLPEARPPDLSWTIPPGADREGAVPTMLGSLRAHVGVDGARRLAVVRISGDVIAPVATVRALEAALAGVPALRGEIERALDGALREDARRWVLGIDAPRDVAAAVMEALR